MQLLLASLTLFISGGDLNDNLDDGQVDMFDLKTETILSESMMVD